MCQRLPSTFGNGKNLSRLPPLPPSKPCKTTSLPTSLTNPILYLKGSREMLEGVVQQQLENLKLKGPGFGGGEGQEVEEDSDDDIDDIEEEESDLYEPPPCDLQSRELPPIWMPQGQHRVYSDRSFGGSIPQVPPKPEQAQKNPWPQGAKYGALFPPRPAVLPKRAPPLPPADRRMSLPCPVLHSAPPGAAESPQGEDDLYVTILDMMDTKVGSQDDTGPGFLAKYKGGLEDAVLLGKPWYAGDMERRKAEGALRRMNKDGCFLVRQSFAQSHLQPYTLAVLYKDHIYNIPVRSVGPRGYCLGKEGKRHEETFPSIVQLIENYYQEPLYLINRQTKGRESTCLLYPAML
ncbi:SH2 domain-containing protein 6 isoform X2 [Xenopus tropicalis]|uniref:SH2 domain-containing protein 6 isoform X2 n=1 Tax=Xenopus tropicalis TaxID=8364 RepID=A0A8J0R1W4_XENTR|nr:SH2 domain-containing protein 6 isoform X2 [Xenopus tropicalis]|eukprot:XP_004912627.1 PREDICTED: SH2 domain-containing protein 6 isoform X3 [Xenopus tropicalis]